jgi:hypothetical protein
MEEKAHLDERHKIGVLKSLQPLHDLGEKSSAVQPAVDGGSTDLLEGQR